MERQYQPTRASPQSFSFLMHFVYCLLWLIEATRAAEVLLSFPLFLDGQERSIVVYEGQAVRHTVASFLEQHKVAMSHLDSVTREVRRKLMEDPNLVSRVMDEDKIQVASTVVDVGGGRTEEATFVLDGREEVQVLQWCNDRDLGPPCVSGILKNLAQRVRQQQVNKQAAMAVSQLQEGSGPKATSPTRQAMLMVDLLLNGQATKMIGFEGQTVAQVVDDFLALNPTIPLSYKDMLMNEAVDSLLGVMIRRHPLSIDLRTNSHEHREEAEQQTALKAVPSSYPNSTFTRTTSSTIELRKVYQVELYVNQEQRLLLIERGEDIEAKAHSWCLEQGTRDPEHVRFVLEVIRQTIREQEVRDELAPFQDRINMPLRSLLSQSILDHHGKEKEEDIVVRFNASESYPEVVIRRQYLESEPAATPLTVAQAWCEANDIRPSEVSLVALMLVKHVEAWINETANNYYYHDNQTGGQPQAQQERSQQMHHSWLPHLPSPSCGIAMIGTLGASIILHRFLTGGDDD